MLHLLALGHALPALLAAAQVWPLPSDLSLGTSGTPATLVRPAAGRRFFQLLPAGAAAASPGSTAPMEPPAAPAPVAALGQAFVRYEALLFNCSETQVLHVDGSSDAAGVSVSGIDVAVADAAAPLALGVSERYSLLVGACPLQQTAAGAAAACRGRIEADTVYGTLHALRTLVQLVHGCGALLATGGRWSH